MLGDGGERTRPRILFLTCHLPHPPISGGRRREYELIRRLSERYDIHVCAVTKTYEHDRAQADALRDYCVAIDLFPKSELKVADGLPSATRSSLVRRNASAELLRCVHQNLAWADLIHVEGFYMVQHVPQIRSVSVMLVEQNVEFHLWRQRAHLARGIEDRTPMVMEYLRTLRDETAAWRKVDIIGTLTERDRQAVRDAGPALQVRLVPDGVDHLAGARFPDAARADRNPRIVFVANFAYEPNVDAALFLCHEIVSRIHRSEPAVDVWLVGNSPPQEVWDLSSDRVVVTGTVPDVRPYLETADLVVCPLRIGGGIKVKVLEAMFRGKTVVTTTVGAQGLERATGALAVHDEPGRFAKTVVALLRDPERRRAIGESARAFALGMPTWDDAARAVENCYQELLALSSTGGSGTGFVHRQPAR